MQRTPLYTLAAIVVLLTLGSQARSQVVSLDGVYAGTARWHDLHFPRAAFGANGENAAALSGLTSAGISSEGFVDFTGGYFQNDDLGNIYMAAPNGDTIEALISGEGTIYHYAGTFTVTTTGGTGRFAGATGLGSFLMKAGTYTSDVYGFTAPATLMIRGSVAPGAVPEPGTLALLSGPLMFGGGCRFMRRRSKNSATT